MKLPNKFPNRLNDAKMLFATRPKCPSSIYDMENREFLNIEYYAIAQYSKNSGVNLFSIDDCFNVIGNSYFTTIEEAMSELEPDNISPKEWKRICA